MVCIKFLKKKDSAVLFKVYMRDEKGRCAMLFKVWGVIKRLQFMCRYHLSYRYEVSCVRGWAHMLLTLIHLVALISPFPLASGPLPKTRRHCSIPSGKHDFRVRDVDFYVPRPLWLVGLVLKPQDSFFFLFAAKAIPVFCVYPVQFQPAAVVFCSGWGGFANDIMMHESSSLYCPTKATRSSGTDIRIQSPCCVVVMDCVHACVWLVDYNMRTTNIGSENSWKEQKLMYIWILEAMNPYRYRFNLLTYTWFMQSLLFVVLQKTI